MLSQVVLPMMIHLLVSSICFPAQETERQEADRADAAVDHTLQEFDSAGWVLATKRAAIERMLRTVGIPKGLDHRVSCGVVVRQEDDTPYLQAQVVGRPLWRIEVHGWRIELKSSPPGFTDRYARTFDIYLDPETGHPVRIESRWPASQPAMRPPPSAASAAEQMQRAGQEQYHGFPEQAPEVSFVQALDSVQRIGGNPMIAKQIVALYVMWSSMGNQTQPVWAITLRGVPPRKRRGKQSHEVDSQWRYIVNAQTGECVIGTNVPVPDVRAPGPED